MTSLLPWLAEDEFIFPDIDTALSEPNGLLAAGGDLSITRLLVAYRHGIFPWYEEDQPILWWSPDPRCVIDPATYRPSKSLRKRMNRRDYVIGVDRDFESVIAQCGYRSGNESTWITDDMKTAYINLHRAGYAHSIECYIGDDLAGGLYGVSIGRLFFGESMFHRVRDASKIAFHSLMTMMHEVGCPLVDCQIPNPHLLSMGAVEIPRSAFRGILEKNIDLAPIDWPGLADFGVIG